MDYHDRYESRKKRSDMAAMLGDVLELPDLESSAAGAVRATELLN
jgi:hypothetical protein